MDATLAPSAAPLLGASIGRAVPASTDLLLLSRKKAATPTIARDPTMVPTAMPAMSPLDRPAEAVEGTAVAVTVAAPESNPASVTLKHGTDRLKSAVSTKYYCRRVVV